MSLGVTASHRRTIKPGTEYNKYFAATKRTDPIINKDATTYETVDLIAKLVPEWAYQTKALSKLLKRNSVAETCKAIFNFCYTHIQYHLDTPGVEQLRTPNRTWQDRKNPGVDCDCFSIFVSSILYNLGINHAYRICEINNKGYYQHIYVIVPYNQTNNSISGPYLTIDPVLDTFNKEAPGITKTKDKFIMGIPVQVLNGLDNNSSLLGFDEIDQATTLEGVYKATRNTLQRQLRATKAKVQSQPRCLAGIVDNSGLLGALDAADQLLEDGSDQALAKIYSLAVQPGSNPYAMLGSVDGVDGLGFLKKVASAAKNVKNKVQEAAKKVQNEVKTGAASAQQAAKKAVSTVKTVAKKAVQATLKYNPVSTAARAGFLLAMKLNFQGIAGQIKWGYATPEQLKKYGISSADADKAKKALANIENMFVNTLKGEKQNLKNAILSGKNALSGLNGLGEPVTGAVTVSAASAFIAKAIQFIKGLNIKPKNITDAVDIAKGLTNKPNTTIQNDQIVVDTNNPQPQTETSETSFVPAPTDSNNYSYTPNPGDGTASDIQVIPNSQNNAVPPAPQTEKKSNTGKVLLTILAVVGVGAVAVLSNKKSKSLSGPGKTKKRAKSKSKSKSKQTIIIK